MCKRLFHPWPPRSWVVPASGGSQNILNQLGVSNRGWQHLEKEPYATFELLQWSCRAPLDDASKEASHEWVLVASTPTVLFPAKLCGVLVFSPVPAASSASRLRVPPPRPTSASHHLCHHTPSLSYHLHTTLSHTIFVIPSFTHHLCHTIFVTHIFVTHIFVTHIFVAQHLSHTCHPSLSHTIFHTLPCHTPSLAHTIFVITQLCHTPSLSYHLSHTHTSLSYHLSRTHTSLHLRFGTCPWQAWRFWHMAVSLWNCGTSMNFWHMAGSGGALGSPWSPGHLG